METSAEIGAIAAAASKMQAQIIGAVKDSANPFFKSTYADLASVLDAARKPMTDNELCLIQGVSTGDGMVHVTSMLAHSSGQWFKATVSVTPVDMKPQTIGTCATYLRRYGGAALLGVAQIDDDGNAASGKIGETGVPKGITPHGDLGKNVDTRVANKWAAALIKEQDNPHRLVDIWGEVKTDHDLGVAVWGAIPKAIKDRINSAVAANGDSK